MKQLPAIQFTYDLWRNGSLLDLGVFTRKESIIENKNLLIEHAVGWCRAENLSVRPKKNCYAVMFWFDNGLFWTHIRIDELLIWRKINEI